MRTISVLFVTGRKNAMKVIKHSGTGRKNAMTDLLIKQIKKRLLLVVIPRESPSEKSSERIIIGL